VIHRFTRLAAGLAAAALLAPASARGQSLEISPVLVELSASTPSVVVTVRNGGAVTMRYQVGGQRWSEDRAGQPTLLPADDLAIFPPLFQLAPGASRKVRVGATVAPAPLERSWRLMVEELPDAVAAAGHQVAIRTRFAIPVFLAPTRTEVRCELGLKREAGRLELVVANRGTTRVKPLTTTVQLSGADGARLRDLEIAPWYVLAGGERAWPVDVPREVCAGVRHARVVADVGGRRLEASLELPSGACGP
jgi:fimbrial chaperone protein